ncbi:MAG: lipoprotein signal peptidase [Bacteroidia bacterium]
MKKAQKYFLLALSIIVLDQIIKVIVKLNMELGEEIRVIGGLFKIHFIENNGAAFGLTIASLVNGLGLNMSEETGKLILSLFSIGAVVAIGVVLYRLAEHRSPLPYFVAMIFGGAVGNIIDRTFYGVFFSKINYYEGGLFHGRVVDMFYLDIWKGRLPEWMPLVGGDYTSLWPIFNIADSAISIGIVIILIFQSRFFRMDEKARTAETQHTGSSATPPLATDTATAVEVPETDPLT